MSVSQNQSALIRAKSSNRVASLISASGGSLHRSARLACPALLVERLADCRGKVGHPEWLAQKPHPGIETAVMGDDVLAVARHEQYFRLGPTARHFVGQRLAVENSRDDDNGQKQVVGLVGCLEGRHADRAVGRLRNVV